MEITQTEIRRHCMCDVESAVCDVRGRDRLHAEPSANLIVERPEKQGSKGKWLEGLIRTKRTLGQKIEAIPMQSRS